MRSWSRSGSLKRAVLWALAATVALVVLAPVDALAAPSVGGCPVFPADNVWNTDISSLPVNGQSGAWLSNMGGSGRMLHPGPRSGRQQSLSRVQGAVVGR